MQPIEEHYIHQSHHKICEGIYLLGPFVSLLTVFMFSNLSIDKTKLLQYHVRGGCFTYIRQWGPPLFTACTVNI